MSENATSGGNQKIFKTCSICWLSGVTKNPAELSARAEMLA